MAEKTSHKISDFNLERINTQEYSEHLKASMKMGNNLAVFARRGSGKTLIAKDSIAQLGMKELYLNLSVLERVDLAGYPDVMAPARNSEYVSFVRPAFYKSLCEGDQKVVALLDEVDKADPSIWAPLLEFTQFRSVNGIPLPNLHAIVMTGNLIAEGGNRPSLPLLDRSEKYLLEADVNSWIDWSGRKGSIHPSVIAYINDHPQNLFGEVDASNDRYADASPRGWHRVSDILYTGESMGLGNDILHKKVSGCVGKQVGLDYFSYYEHYKVVLPIANAVFNGDEFSSMYKKLQKTQKIVVSMVVGARMASILDNKEKKVDKNKALEHTAKFYASCEPEDFLLSVRSQIQLDRIISHNLLFNDKWKPLLKDSRLM